MGQMDAPIALVGDDGIAAYHSAGKCEKAKSHPKNNREEKRS
jgi:hypothetical protein